MATTTSINVSYVGNEAGEYFGIAFKNADSISRGLVTLHENVNAPVYLRKIDYTSGRQAYTCGWSPAGGVSLGEVKLEPTEIKNDIELCRDDFRTLWEQAQMGASAWDYNFEDVDGTKALISEILSTEMNAIDFNIWNGLTASGGNFPGIIPQLTATSSGAVKTTATSSISYTNVIGELSKFLTSVPTAVKKTGKFMISPDIADALTNAQSAGQLTYGQQLTDTQFKWGRYLLEIVDNFPDRTMLFGDPKQFNVGTGRLADMTTLLIDSSSPERMKEGNAIIKMVYTAGTAVVRKNEVAIYSPSV